MGNPLDRPIKEFYNGSMNTLRSQSVRILFSYSIISFMVTLIVAFILSLVLIRNMEEKLINSHADFFRSFIQAIPHNYSEILKDFDIHSKEENHHHEEDVWEHFKTDLLQTPSIIQFRIYDVHLNMKWTYFKEENVEEGQPILNSQNLQSEAFFIAAREPEYIIHYYFPITHEGKELGLVEIVDIDDGLKELLDSTRIIIIRTIVLGGISLYTLLFGLFYRSFRNQKAISTRLDKSQSLTIHTMSLLAELRDDNTGKHIVRTSLYCRVIATALHKDKTYSKYISQKYIEDMERSAPLHDIGKVGIPDSILNKPGKLTDQEFEIVKKHPQLGADVLENAVNSLDFQSFFEIGYQIVLHHHENWDGTGYPSGLKGSAIPLSARIMTLADVYDALRTERPYKDAFTHEKAMKIIIGDAGKKFDPHLVEVLEGISGEFENISKS